MSDLSPQEHVDARVLAYYGSEFDEDDHLADDLEEEAVAAGLLDVRVIGLEGPGAQAIEISRSHDPSLIAAARRLAEAHESQPGLRDLSPHLLAMGRTPG